MKRSTRRQDIRCLPTRALRWIPLGLMVIALSGSGSMPLLATEGGGKAEAMSDAQIQEALLRGCKGESTIERFDRFGPERTVLGPLWLEEAGEDRTRGVILTPFLRLYLHGRGTRKCEKLDLEEARELAGPEIWVVLWRTEDPPSEPYSDFTTMDQKVLLPTQVRYRADGEWHEPLWTRSRDPWVRGWFGNEWNEKTSLLAGFAVIEPGGSLFVDYKIQEDGRSYLTESTIFTFAFLSEKAWDLAWGRFDD